ncbi:MAG: alpha/beta hydrolase [Deltaproteobacteria bacterium]|nr:alpha/beta hydrolase [Deltaproteobacteria bacterium]
MPHERINGILIYYECYGDATEKGDIVFLHHGMGCTKIWKDICPAFLKKGYRLLMYDRRGYGRSEAGQGFMDFYVSDRFRTESVEEMHCLISAMGIKRFHIIGQCEGGVVGADYAARHPDQVESMVISSTQCFSRVPMVEKNASHFPMAFAELDVELRQKMTEWHGERAEVLFNQFRRFGGAYGTGIFDLRPVLSSVRCPTLVLYPDRSSIFEVEQGVAMYRSLPQGELAVLPKCGHNTYQYRPEEYVRTALDFFARHEDLAQETPEMTGMSCLAVKAPLAG